MMQAGNSWREHSYGPLGPGAHGALGPLRQ